MIAGIKFLRVSLKLGLEIVKHGTILFYRHSSSRNLYIGVYQLSDEVTLSQSKHITKITR